MAHPCAPSIAMIVLGLIGLACFVVRHFWDERKSAAEG